MTAEVREGWIVSKKAVEKLDVERFNLKKLNELEVSKQYQIKISKRFAASQNLNYSKDIKQGLEHIKKNIKLSAEESLGMYEWKQHKPRFDAVCSQFLDQRKQAIKHWLQDSN